LIDLRDGLLGGGLGLFGRQLEIARIEASQGLPLLYRLVIVNEHFFDRAGNAKAQRMVVSGQVGVVGLLESLQSIPPIDAKDAGTDKSRPEQSQPKALKPASLPCRNLFG
jgi:hypothetical protein